MAEEHYDASPLPPISRFESWEARTAGHRAACGGRAGSPLRAIRVCKSFARVFYTGVQFCTDYQNNKPGIMIPNL